MTAPALAAQMHELDHLADSKRWSASRPRWCVRRWHRCSATSPRSCQPYLLIAFVWSRTDHDPVSTAKVRAVLEAHSILGPSFIFATYTGSAALAVRSFLRMGRQRLHPASRARSDRHRPAPRPSARRVGREQSCGLVAAEHRRAGRQHRPRRAARIHSRDIEVLRSADGSAARHTFHRPGRCRRIFARLDALQTKPFWLAVAGVVLIGALNVGVSFALALRVAMRAVDISDADRAQVYRAIRRTLLSHPAQFLWPPRDSAFGPTFATGTGSTPHDKAGV